MFGETLRLPAIADRSRILGKWLYSVECPLCERTHYHGAGPVYIGKHPMPPEPGDYFIPCKADGSMYRLEPEEPRRARNVIYTMADWLKGYGSRNAPNVTAIVIEPERAPHAAVA